MKIEAHKTERLHSLDSLRAIMMLLGLVIHSTITYAITDYGAAWPLKDPNSTHLSNDFIVDFIHAFRMQIFFVVSGFFGAMLFYERTPMKMVKNRVDRIVLPFIVFVLLLWPTIFFAFRYSGLVFSGNPDALTIVISRFSDWNTFVPPRTFHLWFLYYLAMITFFVVVLALVAKRIPVATGTISKVFNWAIQKPILRILVFAGISAIVYFIMGTSQVNTSTSFIPDFNTFLYYFVFYTVGWILFKSKHLLDTFKKYDWMNTILGIILFSILFFMNASFGLEAKIILKSIMLWLFIFGITGLFIRYGSNHSARMRYISDSSYWVYLIHLPFTAFIPSLIVDWPIPATLKFLFVLISTGVICYVSYHYLVRGTFIGKFLNGRKYSRKIADIRQAQEAAQVALARN
ncbi:acyltransferase family protein [Rhodonellum sp.]|uniref:acyltransferase family protein n=1 Tax=Rhodonellum sp. TaxID=2231180 RepID=UPI002723FC71|nr:acyltransferase family protein [Rhodonellum sp.]MDO9553496.1 acyltransferase family protein [Rhodonellum sp.]